MPVWIVPAVALGATLCSMTSFVPQLVKIWRERRADDVSTRMYLVTVTGFSLWTAYGLMTAQPFLILSNLVCLGLSGAILVLKLRLPKKKAAEP